MVKFAFGCFGIIACDRLIGMTICAKLFRIFIIAFTPAIVIAVIAVFTNFFYPDDIFYNPLNVGNYIGIKEAISFIKAIDTIDYYTSFCLAIASGVTYILAKLGL
jgi:hypothetical protein